MGKRLFFPGGQSKVGTVDEFDFYVVENCHRRVDTETVGELYEHLRVKLLHLYVVSKALVDNGDKELQPDVVPMPRRKARRKMPVTDEEQEPEAHQAAQYIAGAQQDVHEPGTLALQAADAGAQQDVHAGAQQDVHAGAQQDVHAGAQQDVQLYPDERYALFNDYGEEEQYALFNDYGDLDRPDLGDNGEEAVPDSVQVIKLHRGHVLEELLEYYTINECSSCRSQYD